MAASDKLAADFGSWEDAVEGDINRFQRINDDLQQPFNDAAPSNPVSFTAATWGSPLASFGGAGVSGNEEVVRHERQQLRGGGGGSGLRYGRAQ